MQCKCCGCLGMLNSHDCIERQATLLETYTRAQTFLLIETRQYRFSITRWRLKPIRRRIEFRMRNILFARSQSQITISEDILISGIKWACRMFGQCCVVACCLISYTAYRPLGLGTTLTSPIRALNKPHYT